jgi:hypothetical protein
LSAFRSHFSVVRQKSSRKPANAGSLNRYATFRVKSKAEEGKIMTEKIAPNLGDVQTTLLLPLWGRAVEYNTPANSGHRVNLLKTIKFTHYVKDKKKTQCSL